MGTGIKNDGARLFDGVVFAIAPRIEFTAKILKNTFGFLSASARHG